MLPHRRLAAALIAPLLAVAHGLPASAQGLPPSEWVIGPQQRTAFITLDGEVRPSHLAEVLDDLDRVGADVTFFLPGSWIEANKKLARRVVEDGHLLGNRGYGTQPFTELSDEEIVASVERAEGLVVAAGGSSRPFLRVPKGKRDTRVLTAVGTAGYRSVRWTHHPGGGVSGRIATKAVRRAQAGSVISLDLWRESHRNALPRIIEGLRERRFSLRTVRLLRQARPVRWDVSMSSGSSGDEVEHLQRTLSAISYPTGPKDGSFGYATLQAVYAFEKAHGMARDGVVTPADMSRMVTARRPQPKPRGPEHYVEVDVSRQVLFEVRKGRVFKTLPVSTGNEEYYEQDGQTYKAHTPRGEYVVERKIPGWRESRLGKLWYPSYFVGGFAIHGSESVPTYPASHGCVRIPMYVTVGFYERNPIGTPVFVHD